MDYREVEVPGSLRRQIRCLWRLRDQAPSSSPQTLYPDGCCELILHLGTPMRFLDGAEGWQDQAAGLFAAQQRAPIRLAAQGPLDCLGVRLQPAASAAVAGARLSALRDRIVDLRALGEGFAAGFAGAMSRFDAEPGQAWAWLEEGIGGFAPDARIEQAVAALEAAQGRGRIAPLAGAAGLAPRRFQTLFLEQVGLGAKEFARVLRLQATLRQLDAGGDDLAGVAAERGYADQAHATRELQRFTGLTPARLQAALRAGRDEARAIRLAAAFVRGHA